MKPHLFAPARDIVVIAASAGGLQALMALLSALPPDLPAAIAIAFHRSRFSDGMLLPILQKHSTLPVVEPPNGEVIAHGTVYLAPRDRHMELHGGVILLHRGPELHHARPAADALFVSAAATLGPRLVGIILSGGGFDGVRGCLAIKRAGGMVLVQKPDDAIIPFMPKSAISQDDVDGIMTAAEMPEVLVRLASPQHLEKAS